ncbi:unnamed protein product [Schistosoma guineensis]|nr:unnamed protein product [Schistosoma guineensis]
MYINELVSERMDERTNEQLVRYRNVALALPVLASTSVSDPPCSSMMLFRFEFLLDVEWLNVVGRSQELIDDL